MGSTFSVCVERVDCDPGYDGVVGVFNTNTVASGRLISIESIAMSFPSPFGEDMANLYGTNGRMTFDRISAYSGGTEIASAKFDTSAGSMPSQVKLMGFPDSVTESGGCRRAIGDCSSFGYLTSISFQTMMRAPGVCDGAESGRNAEGHNVLHKGDDSNLQAVVLREGEGLACIKRAFGIPQAHTWSFTVRISGTAKTYRYSARNLGSPRLVNQPIWALFNGSGSGVVLEVMVVNHVDLGESNIPKMRIVRSGGICGIGEGVAVTPIKHDTAADLTGVSAFAGPFQAYPLARDLGVRINYLDYQVTPTAIADQQRADCFRMFLMAGPIYNVLHAPSLRFENASERWPGDRRGVFAINDELVLTPGQGIVIVGGGNGLVECSEGAYVDVEIIGRVFSYQAVSVAYPVVGNAGLVKAS